MATAVAVNLLNGRSKKFLAFLDTGADQTSLSGDLLEDLDIDPESLPEIPIGGAEGTTDALACDFIKIGFLGMPSMKKYFPNGEYRVPVHFSRGPFNLLGREELLDLCIAMFDGPNGRVTLEF